MQPIDYASIFSPLIGIIRGALYFKLLKRTILLIWLLLTLSFFIDIICWVLGSNGINNLAFIQLYGFLEGILLLLFFGEIIKEIGQRLKFIIPAYVVIYLLDITFIESFFEFTTWFQLTRTVIFIVLCIFFLFQVFDQELDIFNTMLPEFLVVAGLLFYLCGVFFTVLLSSDMLTESNIGNDSILTSWIFHNAANLLKNIFFTVAIWKGTQK